MKNYIKIISNIPRSAIVAPIIQIALEKADPQQAVENVMKDTGHSLLVGGKHYKYQDFQRIRVIGLGKAVSAMTRGVITKLSTHLDGGIIVCKHIEKDKNVFVETGIKVVQGGHPVPSDQSVASARQLIEFTKGSLPNDLYICLISGGGSALLTHPVTGVSLTDLQQITRQLLACGAEIDEMNTIRKHLDDIKGGGLARYIFPATMVTLILSDVIGNPLDTIASGPTVSDSSTFEDAWNILSKYHLEKVIPSSIKNHFLSGINGEYLETLKAGDPVLDNVHNMLVGSNYQSAVAAAEKARSLGFNTHILTTFLRGEASQVGKFMASIARQVDLDGNPIKRPACFIAGGETTVTIRGQGVGGRNQELALGAVKELSGIKDVILVAIGTDGEDGPTDAAGAYVTGETYIMAKNSNLSPQTYLDANDSYHFFQKMDGLIHTGPTGTNVNDLTFLFCF